MIRKIPVTALLILFLIASCATTKKRGGRTSFTDLPGKPTGETETGAYAPGTRKVRPQVTPGEDGLRERFANLVRETQAVLQKGEPGPDFEKFKEFYDTPLEKDAMFLLARTYESAGNWEKALDSFELLEAKYPDTKGVTAGISRVLLELASRSLNRRQAKAAKEYLNYAREKFGDVDSILYNSAIASLLEGNRDEGLALLDGTSPAFKKSVLHHLLSSQLAGKDITLSSDLKELPRDEKSAILNFNAVIALEKGEVEKAERLIEQVNEGKLEMAETPTISGNVLFENGRFKEAAEQFQRGIETNPSIPENYLNLGIVSEIFLEDFALARSCYTAYIDLAGRKSEEVSKWLINLGLREKSK